MIWFLLVGGSFVTGLSRTPRWTILVWPGISIGLGIYVVANEQPAYDMHGFGYALGGITAVASAVAWLAGRGVGRLRSR